MAGYAPTRVDPAGPTVGNQPDGTGQSIRAGDLYVADATNDADSRSIAGAGSGHLRRARATHGRTLPTDLASSRESQPER